MADTQVTSSSAVFAQQYWDKVFNEYLGKLTFKGFMGTDTSSPIFVHEQLTQSKGGTINVPLVMALSGSGVSGESTLEGNEDALSMYSQAVTLTEYANAIRDAGNLTKQYTEFELLDQFRPALTDWLAHRTDQLIIDALHDIAGTAYGSASEATKDTWVTNNTDRLLFGAATSNHSGNDHSAALANIDSTNDTMVTTQISLAKRIAQLADPKIRPWKLDNGLEYYLMVAHPYCVRDLKQSTVFQNAQRDGLPRGMDNPLFTGAVGYWDGVLVVESDKVPVLASVGASSINVAANFLCGAQACVLAQGAYDGGVRVKLVEKTFDYDRQKGVAIMSMFRVAKAYYNSLNHGMVKVYSACVAD